MKTVAILSISYEAGMFYRRTLVSVFRDQLEIVNYSLESTGFESIAPADLYLVATTADDIYAFVISKIPDPEKIVLVRLTFLKEGVDRLRGLAPCSALLVNLSENMANECIADLRHLGITDIDFIPFYPGCSAAPVPLAITPGERRYVPAECAEIIDVGDRLLSDNTISEIALRLGMKDVLSTEAYDRYVSRLVAEDYSITALSTENLLMENRFDVLSETIEPALIGTTSRGSIHTFNHKAETYTGLSKAEALGAELAEALPAFAEAVRTAEPGQPTLIRHRGLDLGLRIAPILRNGTLLGHYLFFEQFNRSEERQNVLRKQLFRRSDSTKYSFDDIIAVDANMIRAKNIARRMARTDLSVLLTGESGTGKELFAHSIHHASPRRDGPFVAINCSAIPDELLESELFGYVEGSFTGARKQGKIGLFEYAHRGSIFLDEIETMSKNLQTKLLRVLEEREIMKLGDTKTISIDVRIIAASNENIYEMAQRGEFRKDLYYRLNTLPVEIPPLRERPGDIKALTESICQSIGATYRLSQEVVDVFRSYNWDGNVRELKNILEYLRFMDVDPVRVKDLPPYMLQAPAEKARLRLNPNDEDLKLILSCLYRHPAGLGRRAICAYARESGRPVSEARVRRYLEQLRDLGYIESPDGAGGSRLAPAHAEDIRRFLG